MTQEALKLALEALLHAHHEDEAHPRTLEAITAIKEALAQEQEPWCMKMNGCKTKCEDCPVAVAQPHRTEQEPVVGTKTWFEDGKVVTQHLTAKDIYKEPEQEPVAHWSDCAVHSEPAYPKGECDCGGFATPPQRTFVGLTDEEIQECYSEAYKIVQGRQLEIAFYKTIEAKLKLKNGYAEEKNT